MSASMAVVASSARQLRRCRMSRTAGSGGRLTSGGAGGTPTPRPAYERSRALLWRVPVKRLLPVVLVLLGVASIALSLALLRRPSLALGRLQLAVGCAAVIACIVLALNRISAANNVTAAGPSQTAYGYASGIAFIAAATIAFTALRRIRAS